MQLSFLNYILLCHLQNDSLPTLSSKAYKMVSSTDKYTYNSEDKQKSIAVTDDNIISVLSESTLEPKRQETKLSKDSK